MTMNPDDETYTYAPLSSSRVLRPIYDLRRRLPDVDTARAEAGAGRKACFFSDQEYAAFLQDAGGSVLYAQAAALYAIAGNYGFAARYVQLNGGGAVDGRTAASLVRQQAADIRAQAEATVNTPTIAQIYDASQDVTPAIAPWSVDAGTVIEDDFGRVVGPTRYYP